MANNQRSIIRRAFPTAHKLVLDHALVRAARLVKGDVLVLGSGEDDYRALFPEATSIVTSDISLPNRGCDILADAHSLPFFDGQFDFVVAVEVFEHLHTPRLAAKELSRGLRARGSVLLTLPFCFRVHGDPFDYQRFTGEGLKRLFRGLVDVEVRPVGGRLVVCSDILTTHTKSFAALRCFNHLLVWLVRGASHDCPSGYIVTGSKLAQD